MGATIGICCACGGSFSKGQTRMIGRWEYCHACADMIEGEDDADQAGCNTCGGHGYIITCCDDLCRGNGECMHGDGQRACPTCGGASL